MPRFNLRNKGQATLDGGSIIIRHEIVEDRSKSIRFAVVSLEGATEIRREEYWFPKSVITLLKPSEDSPPTAVEIPPGIWDGRTPIRTGYKIIPHSEGG